MIVILSSSSSERTALTALCENRGWVALPCASLSAAARLVQRTAECVLVVRHRLTDGYSDQLLTSLGQGDRARALRCLVLIAAGTSSAVEARQINLGAECVLRDPLKIDVLLAYLEKLQRDQKQSRDSIRPPTIDHLAFAGGVAIPLERKLQHGSRSTPITPREAELIELLVRAAGEVVTYETLFSVILNRPFRGDTSNMRVLLGKLSASASRIGLGLRQCVEVIPKSGYRYRAPPSAGNPSTPPVTPPRRAPAADSSSTKLRKNYGLNLGIHQEAKVLERHGRRPQRQSAAHLDTKG